MVPFPYSSTFSLCKNVSVFLCVFDECEYLLTTVEITRPTGRVTDWSRDIQPGAFCLGYVPRLITKPHTPSQTDIIVTLLLRKQPKVVVKDHTHPIVLDF